MKFPLKIQKLTFALVPLFVLYFSALPAQITVDRFMGVNTLREDPIEKMKAVGFIREYHSWYLNEGNPSMVLPDFSPSYPNASYRWNKIYQDLTYIRFDEFYEEIRNTNDIQIAPTFLGNLFQIVDPDRYTNESDNHIVQEQMPIAEGANSLDPASYIAHAAYLYHYAARYGHNVFSANDFNNIIVPRTHAEETPKTGLGLVEYMESWNEQDKWWWAGTNPTTQFSPQEYATMLSADYDGHGQTLGLGVGIKNADPNMKVVMGGLAQANLDYIRAMVDWSVTNRSGLSGADVLPFQVLNIHHYIGNNPNFLQSTQGISPERANLRTFLKTFDTYRDSLNTAMGTNLEIWLSEFGYDTYGPGATGQPVVTAPDIGPYDSYEVQGQWIMRIYLEALAAEIDRAMLFFLRDEQTPYAGLYTSSGLLENAANNYKPKNSWFYTYTMKNVLTDMVFDSDVSPCGDTTCARIYKFKEINNGTKTVYAIWSPTSTAKVFDYEFTLDDLEDAKLVSMELPSIYGVQEIITEPNPNIEVTEKPAFIIKNGNYFEVPIMCAASPAIENPTCTSLNVRLNAINGSGKYQLWHMQGNFSAVDFSHRLATLVNEDLSPSDSVVTVAGLQSNQPYTFFLFPIGVGESETSKICTATGVTTSNTCKIVVDPAWIYDDYKNTLNPDGLFDNQNDFDPMCDANAGFPVQADLWGFNFDLEDSINVSLDLQAYYYIDALTLHDEGSRGFFTIQTADSPNGPWTTVVDYLTVDYNIWKTLTNLFPADKPVRYLRFIAEKSDAAKVGELFICGRLSNFNPDILPGIGKNGIITGLSCDTAGLSWNHPFDLDIKEYKIFGGPSVVTLPYSADAPFVSLMGLTENTSYNFRVVTIDHANQESADSLAFDVTTNINGECDLVCNFSCSCAICIRPSWISQSSPNNYVEANLVNEQNIVPMPACNYTGQTPNSFWANNFNGTVFPVEVVIDLQTIYDISSGHFFFQGSTGQTFISQYKNSSGQWIEFINSTPGYGWHSYDNLSIRTQFIKLIITDPNLQIGELGFCGTPFIACAPTLDLPNNITTPDTFQAGVITSTAILSSGIGVGFFAENSITLNTGFQATAGVDFLAKITDCNTDYLTPTELPVFANISLPTSTPLQQNNLTVYPNPFTYQTTLAYELKQPAKVQLAIFDATGRNVSTLVDNQSSDSGKYELLFSNDYLENGFYIARLQVGQTVILQKMILLGK